MLDSKEIAYKFGTLHEYEAFHIEWTRVCALLNPTEKNTNRLEVSEKRAMLLGVGV